MKNLRKLLLDGVSPLLGHSTLDSLVLIDLKVAEPPHDVFEVGLHVLVPVFLLFLVLPPTILLVDILFGNGGRVLGRLILVVVVVVVVFRLGTLPVAELAQNFEDVVHVGAMLSLLFCYFLVANPDQVLKISEESTFKVSSLYIR